MEGTCNECVFPLNKEERKLICSTDSSLIYATRLEKLSCVKELIAAGADVNAACECHGISALMTAAIVGTVDCLKELITAGSNVNQQHRDGFTPLIFALQFGKTFCGK